MGELVLTEADEDLEAKDALWSAIQLLAGEMQKKWQLKAYLDSEAGGLINASIRRPSTAPLWKLVEILSVFVILKNADHVHATNVFNLLGAIPTPINYTSRGENSFLWTQRRMSKSLSGFAGIPDITITNSNYTPTRSNVTDIIEVKSGKISSRLIRQEFAKGYDLKVTSYTILSYHRPTKEQMEGAKLLGIELEPLEFDAQAAIRRERLRPNELISRLSAVLMQHRDRGLFGLMLRQTAGMAEDKQLRRRPPSNE